MDIRFSSLTYFVIKLISRILMVLALFSHAAFADELKDIANLSDQGQQAAALERVNTYLAANPKDPQAMFMKGIILVESNKREDAIKTFTELTEKYPNLPEPYNNLAVLYADAGQYDKAKKALETAIKTHPSYATAHENLGDIYARMASEAYDKALQLDGGNARAQSKLSMIKDLFGTGNKVAVKTVDNSKADSAKPVKTGTMPIRPADKKADVMKAAELDKVATVTNATNTNDGQKNDGQKDVQEAIISWAKAWSAKDVDKYLASYGAGFKPAKNESRKVWEQTRRERVSKPANINVEVSNYKITMIDDNNAKASFKQTYKADGKPIRTDKTLILQKEGSNWYIEQEIASN